MSGIWYRLLGSSCNACEKIHKEHLNYLLPSKCTCIAELIFIQVSKSLVEHEDCSFSFRGPLLVSSGVSNHYNFSLLLSLQLHECKDMMHHHLQNINSRKFQSPVSNVRVESSMTGLNQSDHNYEGIFISPFERHVLL